MGKRERKIKRKLIRKREEKRNKENESKRMRENGDSKKEMHIRCLPLTEIGI